MGALQRRALAPVPSAPPIGALPDSPAPTGEYRRCRRCKQVRPVTEFPVPGPRAPTAYWCRACQRAYNRWYHRESRVRPVVVCSMCHEEKPLKQFYRSTRSPTGVQSRCIECVKKGVLHWRRRRIRHGTYRAEAAPQTLPSKVCGHCGAEKPIEEFAARRDSGDGRQSWCKVCHNGYEQRRRERLGPQARKSVTGVDVPPIALVPGDLQELCHQWEHESDN